MTLNKLVARIRKNTTLGERLAQMALLSVGVVLIEALAGTYADYRSSFEQRMDLLNVLIRTSLEASAADDVSRGAMAQAIKRADAIITETAIVKIKIADVAGTTLIERGSADLIKCNCKELSVDIISRRLVASKNFDEDLTESEPVVSGKIVYVVDQDKLAQPSWRVVEWKLLITAVIAAALGGILFLVRLSVVRPAKDLTSSLEFSKRNDTKVPPPLESSKDELFDLHNVVADAHNELFDQRDTIKKANTALQKNQDELELQIGEKEKAKQEAISVTVEKDLFIANITHQIRTPLQGIMSTMEMVQAFRCQAAITIAEIKSFRASESESFNDLQSLVQRMDAPLEHGFQEVGSVAGLIDDLLSHIDQPQDAFPIAAGPVDIENKVNTLVKPFINMAEERGLSFVTKIHRPSEAAELLLIDWARTSVVIKELIQNAIKFTKRGGVILDLRMRELPVDNGRADKVELEFNVADTGVGISSQMKASLFSSRRSSRAEFEKQYAGVGLGIQKCVRIAKQLNGELSLLRSEIAKGSHFCFKLTVARAPSHFVEAHRKVDDPALERPLSVLYVEDDITCQAIFRRHCENSKWPIRLTIAHNGYEGFELFRTEKFDLVVTDHFMPDVTGLDLIQQIRAYELDNSLKPVPLVVISADARQETKVRFRDSGATRFYTKPYTAETFTFLIESLILGEITG
jgi:signal transduction histidine kinase/ActR/RegA family two-component response regulator